MNSHRDQYSAPRQPTFDGQILGPLELATAPSGLVVTLAAAKLHLRVEHNAEDELISDLLAAAQRFCEQEVEGHRQLLTATYDVPVRRWWGGPLRLPRPPLRSVTWVKYYDTAGTLTTLDSSYYLVRTPLRSSGTVERAPFKVWPVYQSDRLYPITIRFSAGYGAGSDVPATIRQAVKLAVGWFYEKREPTDVELKAVYALLQSEGYGFYG